MFQLVEEQMFSFLRELGGESSAYASHMRDARFTIPTPGLLTKVVELLDAVPLEERDTRATSNASPRTDAAFQLPSGWIGFKAQVQPQACINGSQLRLTHWPKATTHPLFDDRGNQLGRQRHRDPLGMGPEEAISVAGLRIRGILAPHFGWAGEQQRQPRVCQLHASGHRG